MKKENMHEYDSLRDEIVSLQEQQRNVWIYMYVIFCSLFILGLEWSNYLFLFTYIILIPFQCIINNFLWSIEKISTYIRIFFENERTNMHWESFHVYPTYREYWKKRNNSIYGIIRLSGSIHLGLLATGFFCGSILINGYVESGFILRGFDIFLILLSIVLLLIIIKVNCDYKNEYRYELEQIMEYYKKYIENL